MTDAPVSGPPAGRGGDGHDRDSLGDGFNDDTDRTARERRDAASSPESLPPGPEGLPIVGNTFRFVRDPFGFYDVLQAYGDVVGYSIAGYDFVTLLHPDEIERVLLTDASTYEKGGILQQSGVELMEEGVLLTEGETWRRQRTAMQPMFYRERIAAYADVMADYAAETVESWRDGETVDLLNELSTLALRILAKSLFDVDSRERERAIRRGAEAIQERSDASSLTSFLPKWLPTPTNRRFRRATAEFEATVETLVAEHRAADDAGDDLLSLLLGVEYDDGSAMSEREVRDQLVTFLFAGHETTSLAMTYTLYLLAQHPDRLRKLRTEIDDVVDGRPTAADALELDYAERVLTESMRCYPPAYILFRQPTETVELGGYRVPAGTNITLPLFRVHNDPRFYDDPEAFRPERWTDEMESALPDYAYFPFGGGPRHCLGMRFAMLELKLVLATVVSRVEFDIVGERSLTFRPGATLQPKDPIRMRVWRR
ncbi:cytochrome P450 [Haloprofundus salilacus]|uniref:cytochrome P450 n=1 Tax=Haloprofundus salilacus TaxID=2876190 RepID=UPI001CCBF43C|nr:cytochrome P450 [Haloprofundus salilacus]